MDLAKPLPKFLVTRYKGWKATTFEENKTWIARLSDEGQRPRTMVISCCDSRVHVTSIFGAETGEFFIHRNIANLVPPYVVDDQHHGTSAVIDYAVNALKVTNIIIMGHSSCGGVAGCHAMCTGKAPELDDPASFVGRWMDILRGAYEKVAEKGGSDEEQISALEREGVVASLENLMTFPFVKEAVDEDKLSLHGLWINIRDGDLEYYHAEDAKFVEV